MFCLKNCTSSKLARLLDTASKFALFSASGLKDEKLIKKQTYTKIETCKLYSRVFWIFLPNVIKIHRYNFELYRFKVCAFFETQCRPIAEAYSAITVRQQVRTFIIQPLTGKPERHRFYNSKWRTDHWPALTVGSAAQLATALYPNERILEFKPAVCGYTAEKTNPPMPQPSALWPSLRNVLGQRHTIFSRDGTWKAELAWAPRV